MIKKVIIASKNPTKINSVEIGFTKIFPNEKFVFEGVSIPSNVADQPFGDKETMDGALNRVTNAKLEYTDADYWVGIEGGIEKIDNDMEVFAWIVIQSKELTGKSRTSTFFLPKKVIELVDSGLELGEADDIFFARKESGKNQGTVGILTGDIIDRTSCYVESVVLALIPFYNPDIY